VQVGTQPVGEEILRFNGNQEPITMFERDGATGAVLGQVNLVHTLFCFHDPF
jgi:hypothetical protein